jgi:hypothetical protein
VTKKKKFHNFDCWSKNGHIHNNSSSYNSNNSSNSFNNNNSSSSKRKNLKLADPRPKLTLKKGEFNCRNSHFTGGRKKLKFQKTKTFFFQNCFQNVKNVGSAPVALLLVKKMSIIKDIVVLSCWLVTQSFL